LAISAYYAVMLNAGHTGHARTSAEVHLWVMWTSVFSVALAMIWTPGNARMRIMRQLLTTVAIVDVLFTVHLAQPTMYQDGSFKAIQVRVAASHNSSLDLAPGGLQRYQLAPAWSTSEGVPQNKNVLLKIPTLENYIVFYNRFHLDQIKRPVLSTMATGPSRFWCSSQVVVAPASDVTYSAFVARSDSLGKGVLVIHSRDQLLTPSRATSDETIARIHELPPVSDAIVTLKAYSPNELSFEATCAEKGWLLVTDRWSRSWEAIVNGKPAIVWGGNFVFRAVEVEAGKNDVRFTYNAVGFPLLVILSWSVIFLTAACSLHALIKSFHPGK
jgi:hypothetical protein